MIKMHNATKIFYKNHAVDNVSLEIKMGSIHGLLGSNGAGKTTLLKMMAGIYQCDAGTIDYNGTSVFENDEYKAQMIFISDVPYFFRNATLEDMKHFYEKMYPNFSDMRFKQLTQLLKLSPSKRINQLSKGMQRQSAFILALSSRPKIMILDEPFDGLDPIVRHTIKNILIQDVSNHNMALFVSSHNLREMEDFCDTVMIMHEGRLIINKELDDLKENVCKIQMAFNEVPEQNVFKGMNVVEQTIKGRVVTCIVKGNFDQIEEKVSKLNPLIYDILPLSLEEIFTYELGGYGYAIENIIVE